MKGDKEQRESFVAYRSFEKKKLPDAKRLQYYDALFAYGLRQEQPDFQGDVMLECIWECVTPQIDANQQRYLNGLKGGPPAGSRNNPSGRRGKRTNQKLTENLPNENVNVNENGNVTLFGDAEGDAPAPTKQLSFPFTSQKFSATWQELCRQPRWKKKSIDALQMSLNKIAAYPEAYAIVLMEDAIANNYQGLVFANTPANYEQWKKNNSGQPTPPRREARPLSKEEMV